MTPVLLLSQMLGRSGEQLGRRIERAVKRQSALVDELLLFSRASVKAGGCALVATAAASATASVPDGARLVTCRVPDELAARIALPLLESVLSNLLSNAAKYVGDQPDPRVIIEARRDGDRVVIEVQDNGVGMEPAVAAHIFEPFYRAPGRSEPGLGLGLATVHRIVEAHDGCVRVRSRPGEGTTFEVELPAA
jgi:signal transduction histidine kinase